MESKHNEVYQASTWESKHERRPIRLRLWNGTSCVANIKFCFRQPFSRYQSIIITSAMQVDTSKFSFGGYVYVFPHLIAVYLLRHTVFKMRTISKFCNKLIRGCRCLKSCYVLYPTKITNCQGCVGTKWPFTHFQAENYGQHSMLHGELGRL